MQETWKLCDTQNGSSIKALERHKNMQAETFSILLSWKCIQTKMRTEVIE